MSDTAARYPVFLIGAGFNADASGCVKALTETVKYPMTGDLARIAFGADAPPVGSSIEEWFQLALDNGDTNPIVKMCESILRADYYVTQEILGKPTSSDQYAVFLDTFPHSHFLTFNYDGLIEIMLLKRDRWCPKDGFGLPVRADISDLRRRNPPELTSRQRVVHLHGSLYVYARESQLSAPDRAGTQWLSFLEESDFVFDPDMTAHRFVSFERPEMDHNYKQTHERIIAPIPNKARHLKQQFVEKSYEVAESIVSEADRLVCIGYSFNGADRQSYSPIVTLAERRGLPVTVVSPGAAQITHTLQGEFGIDVQTYGGTFEAWAQAGFPGAIA